MRRYQAHNDSARTVQIAQALRPFIARNDTGVVAEKIGETVFAEPSFQAPGGGIVLAGVADE